MYPIPPSPSAVIAVDPAGTVVGWSPAAEKLFGRAAADVVGRDVGALLPSDPLARTLERVRRLQKAETVDVDLPRDGDSWKAALTVTPAWWDAEGRVAGLSIAAEDVDAPLRRGDAQATARRLEGVFAGALDGLLVADTSGRIVLANDRAARVFGVPKEELLRPMAEYPARFRLRAPGDDRLAVPLGFRALAGETVEPLERVITAGDGVTRHLRTGAAPLRDEDGRIEGAVVMISDMTAETRAKEALRASEERYRGLMEGLDAIVWEADATTWEFTYVNRRAEKILGYPVERWLQGKDFWIQILHEEDREAAVRSCTEAVRAGRDNDFEYRVIAADGRVVWIRDLVYITPDEAGRPLRLRGIMFDVTESRRDREALRESESRERARAAELRTVLESTPAIVFIAHDPEARRITGNRAANRLLRISEGGNVSVTAPPGEAPTHFRVFHEGRELALEEYPVQRAARGEDIRNFEEEIVFNDGARIRLLGNAVPIRDAGGAPRGAVAAFVDITERVRAEARVHELNQTLEARVEERTRELRRAVDDLNAFAYSVAHDLRAPLRAMLGFSDFLAEEYRNRTLDADGLGYLERIRQSARRMDDLIQGLLEYSRLGRAEPRLEAVDLDVVVADALAQMRGEIDKTQAEVTVRSPLPRARATRLPLTQALTNLLSNALKFVTAGVRPRVEIRAEDAKDRVRLSVKDNGIGVPAEHRERVFGVFERLHPQAAYPGTGIGLAIVRRAVERMGGRTGVDPAPGGGSVFWIDLPKDVEAR
ncbi:MAG TPA: PAS domain S-box protein [Planctomycetota bacterium]